MDVENSVYSILSPEGFGLPYVLMRKKAKEAVEVMRLTAEDLYQMGIVERVIFEEPIDSRSDGKGS